MSVNTMSGNFSADVGTYIAKKTLVLALKMMALYGLCEMAVMPKGEGRTIKYVRYERVALPMNPLTEGVTPGDTSMSVSEVSAEMDQWGAVIPVSDVAIDSVKHPVLQKAVELASMQATETIDREIAKVLITGTNVYYPSTVNARANIASGNKLDSTVIGKVVANLRTDGAMPFDGQLYVGVIHPFAEEDIINETTFVNAASYSNIKLLMNHEIGTWKGVRWVRSNTLPKVKLVTGASGASSATAGSLAASTTYNAKVSVVDALTGHETFVSAVFNAATGVGETSVAITLPALPSGATAGSKFNIYFGSNGGTLYLSKTEQAASAVVNVGEVPTSGDVAQPTPPALWVYHTFILGKGGLVCAELNKVKGYLTPNTPSDSDPLVQRRKAGWKTDFKAMISNEDFVARIEHSSSLG
jgi:N4-gp56 family major capsid protein